MSIKGTTASTIQGSSQGRYSQSASFGTYFFPGDIGSDVYTNTIQFEAGKASYDGNTIEVNTNKTTDAKVELYMPADISEENSRDWSETEVGSGGQAIANRMGSLNTGEIKNLTDGSNLDGLGSIIQNRTRTGAMNALGQSLGAESAAGAARARSGRAVDPKLEMLFQGVGFREFSFDFSMYPRTEQEATMIYNIINFFKYRSAPELDGGGYFFKWPHIFDIKFQNPDYLFDFEPCACTSVSVNYTPEGMWAQFKQGQPIGAKMSLSFVELNIKTKSHYNSV